MKSLAFFIILIALTIPLSAEGLIQPGQPAPKFSLLTAEGKREALRYWTGDTIRINRYNKKRNAVILSFWSTWCLPCQREIPVLHAFMEKHKEKNIKTFLISLDKGGASDVNPFLEQKGWTLPVLLDRAGFCAKRYGVMNKRGQASLPALVVMDTLKNVIYSSLGFDESEEEFTAKLEHILWPDEFAAPTTEEELSDSLKVTDKPEALEETPQQKEEALPAVKEPKESDTLTTAQVIQ